MSAQFDEAEERALITRYGPTLRRECRFDLDEAGYAYWWQANALVRRAEVVMVVQHPNGQLLVHTKGHYPLDTYRLPSGGVEWGESVLDALAREQWEELGVCLPPVAMPGLIRYFLRYGERTIPFASYLFLLQAAGDIELTAHDLAEAISDFRWIQPGDIRAVADRLRVLHRAWSNWGLFRAIAHDLLVEAWEL